MGDIEQGKGAWLARKKLLSILASRNSTEADGKTLKSVKAMADIQGIDGLVRGLESDTKNGIPQSSVEKRLSTYGKNRTGLLVIFKIILNYICHTYKLNNCIENLL